IPAMGYQHVFVIQAYIKIAYVARAIGWYSGIWVSFTGSLFQSRIDTGYKFRAVGVGNVYQFISLAKCINRIYEFVLIAKPLGNSFKSVLIVMHYPYAIYTGYNIPDGTIRVAVNRAQSIAIH